MGTRNLLNSRDESDIPSWSIQDVSMWLDSIGLNRYKEIFKHHKIDGLALLLLTESDLKHDLEIKVRPEALLKC